MKKEFEIEAGGMDALVAETGTAKRLATPEEMAWPLIFLNSDMASFITGLPFIVDAGTSAMVALKQKKDRMDMRVGSKLFNLGFIQKKLAKQLEPLKDEQTTEKNEVPMEKINDDVTSDDLQEKQSEPFEELESDTKENNINETEIL